MGMGISESMSEMGVFTGNTAEDIVGVSLGYDFTSEHEHGIKELRSQFQCDPEKPGLEAGRINGGEVFSGIVTTKDGDWHYLTSEKEHGYLLKNFERWPSSNDKDLPYKVKAGWGQGGFIFFCTEPKVIFTVREMFEKKDMTLLLGSNGPFKNGGLKLVQFSALPEELLEQARNAQTEQIRADKRLKESKAYQDLHKKKADWKKKYPFTMETPWDYFALSPKGGSENVWLNPNHQQHLSYGWLSLQDIQDWADGKVGTVIRSQEVWDDLCWECSTPVSNLYSFRNDGRDSNYYRYFRRVPPNLHRSTKEALPKFKKPGKYDNINTLPKDIELLIESDIKHTYLGSMFRQIGVYGYDDIIRRNIEGGREYLHRKYLEYLATNPKEDIKISKEAKEYSIGARHTLCLLGFGRYGACNVSEGRGRANLSFWESVMEAEVCYDFLWLCGALPPTRKEIPWKTMEELMAEKDPQEK